MVLMVLVGACWCQVVDCELTIPLSVQMTIKPT